MPDVTLLPKPDAGGAGMGGDAGTSDGQPGEGGGSEGGSKDGHTGGTQRESGGSSVSGGSAGAAPTSGSGGDAEVTGGSAGTAAGAAGEGVAGSSAGQGGMGGEGGSPGDAGGVWFGGASGSAGVAEGGMGTAGASTGGDSSGGVSIGGTETGGAGFGGAAGSAAEGGVGPGGASIGGTASGGASTGGTTSTGGTSSGGASTTGGTSSGGPNTGGAETGGAPPLPCGPEGPSCEGGLTCDDGAGTSCCASLPVQGGIFDRAPGETEPYPATVSSFCLDKYEVTVGRFRKFVQAYNQWHQTDLHPAENEGEHPSVGAGSGWDPTWNTALPANDTVFKDTSHLNTSSSYKTWRDTAESGDAERLPINFVSWYEAFAFCIWDGGRLPTEAEWQYAAQGGGLNWKYPWGDDEPSSTRAVYDCTGDGSAAGDCTYADILPVGSKPDGDGYWEQSDLAGSMWEWNLDWYATYLLPCNDCANTTTAAYRVIRGGSWINFADYLRATYRNYFTPTNRSLGVGFRCARTAQ